MDIVVKSVMGSNLYGTALEKSDMDFAGVFLPDPEDILLCKKISPQSHSSGGKHVANTKDDTDITMYPLHRFLSLVSKADTMALDLLFAPEQAIVQTSTTWKYIQEHRHKLISKQCDSYLGYMRRQVSKYGVKAQRVNSVIESINFLSQFNRNENLITLQSAWIKEANNNCQASYWHHDDEHIEVAGRKFPWGAKIGLCVEALRKIRDSYGARTQAMLTGNGVDWKAVHHSMRAGGQIIELLTTGHITFPRPDAEYLKRVKTGQISVEQAQEEVEQTVVAVEEAREKSLLPEKPDQNFIDELVLASHKQKIFQSFSAS